MNLYLLMKQLVRVKQMNKNAFFALLFIQLMILLPVSTAVIISDVEIFVDADGAVIDWTTSLPADSEVNYGLTTSHGESISFEDFVINHSITLLDLQEYTKYYYEIVSIDENGSVANPYISSFITPDTTPPPKVENFQASGVTESLVVLNWEHVDIVDFENYVIYRDGVQINSLTDTSYTDVGLLPGMTYIYQVAAFDISGNQGEKSDEIIVNTIGEDLTPPVISNLEVLEITDNGAIFFWNTDEESNSKIFYGEEQENLDEGISEEEMIINHSIVLSGLVKDVSYYYKAVSCDEKGNCGESDIGYFLTGSDVVPPFINATIPEYYHTVKLDMPINTEPMTFVKIYVNEQLKRSATSDVNGYILIEDVSLSSTLDINIVKISAEDMAGNVAEQSYSVKMDFEDPVLNITSNITGISTASSINIQGFVDEECTIEFFAELQPFDTTPPEKVSGLMISEVMENSISLTWDDVEAESDLQYYQVYRKEVGIITTTSVNTFIDEAVLPGTIYEYWVSAVDNDCIEGEASEILSVKTMESENAETNVSAEEVIPACGMELPVAELFTSGSFNQMVELGEGINLFKVVARDLAGNEVVYEKEIVSDSMPPLFEEINLYDLSPTYNQNVVITGKLNEPCDIFVYINVEEGEGYDYSGTSEADGSFSIPVKLKKENQGESDDVLFWPNDVKVVAKDIVGNEIFEEEKEIIFQRCGGGDRFFLTTAKNLLPTELTPSLLFRGMGHFTFSVDLIWAGTGVEPEINDADIELIDLNVEELEDYDDKKLSMSAIEVNEYIGSQEIAVSVNINQFEDPTPDGENWTMYDIEKNISMNNNGKCGISSTLASAGLNMDYGCIKAPLELEISYDCEKFIDGEMREVECVQKECIFVDVMIQGVYDTSKLWNDEFLEDMVEFSTAIIDAVDAVLEPLETVSKFLMISCAGMWAVSLIKKATEFASCNILNVDVDSLCSGCTMSNGELDCDTVNNEEGDFAEITGVVCKKCVGAKMNTLNVLKVMNAVCDRVMCPKIPSFDSYAENQASYSRSGVEGSCEGHTVDYSTDMGVERNLVGDSDCDLCSIVPSSIHCTSEDCCAQQYMDEWNSGALFLNELKESACAVGVDDNSSIDCGGVGGFVRGVRNFQLCKSKTNEIKFLFRPGDGTATETYIVFKRISDNEESPINEQWDMNFRYSTEGDIIENGDEGEVSEIVWVEDDMDLINSIHGDCEGILGGTSSWPKYSHEPEFSDASIPRSIVNFICSDFQAQETHIIDPASGLFKAIQSVCIPTITAYLRQLKWVFETFRGCMNQILATGDGSAGYCQSFLSMYVCDIIYYTISCVKKLVPGPASSEGFGAGIGGFMGYMANAMGEMQREVSGRYGNQNTIAGLISGKDLVNSACLLMFGADIDLNFDTLLEGATPYPPIESFALVSGATRRFNGFSSSSGKSNFVYYVPTLLIASEDIQYNIRLICSNDFSCNPDEGFEGGVCDCAHIGNEKSYPVAGGRLGEGETFNDEFYEQAIGHGYRYDAVELRYTYFGEGGGEREDVIVREKISEIGGGAPAHCSMRLGIEPFFGCGTAQENLGKAYFITQKENIVSEDYYLGENIINDEKGVFLNFIVDETAVDDWGNKLPVYIVAELLNEGGETLYKEEMPLGSVGSYLYKEDSTPFQFIISSLSDEFSEQFSTYSSTGGVVDGWKITSVPYGAGNSRLKSPINIGNFNEFFVCYVNGWKVYEEEKDAEMFDCERTGQNLKCEHEDDMVNMILDANYEDDEWSGDCFEVQKQSGGDSVARCAESAEDWKLKFSLHPPQITSGSYIMSDRVMEYYGEEQEVEFDLDVYCKEGEGEDLSAHQTCIGYNSIWRCQCDMNDWTPTQCSDSDDCERGKCTDSSVDNMYCCSDSAESSGPQS